MVKQVKKKNQAQKNGMHDALWNVDVNEGFLFAKYNWLENLCKDFDWGSWLKLSNIEVIVMKGLQHFCIHINVNMYIIFKLS